MPFILADCKRHETDNNSRNPQHILDDHYQRGGSVVHDAPTLDEHYYHFAADEESQRDRGHRNKNQVFTKYQQENKTGEPLGLIRISQLWAWTIEDGK